MSKKLQVGDTLEAIVLEVKEETAIVKFSNKHQPIEARFLTELKTGEEITVEVKGWYNGELLLRVLKENKNNIDYQA